MEFSHQTGRNVKTQPFRREQIAGPNKWAAPMRLIRTVGKCVDQRLQLGAPMRETMDHPIPRETASWAYVFGSAAMSAFALQLVTGILLALIYVPSASEAWNSLQTLNHDVSLGSFI